MHADGDHPPAAEMIRCEQCGHPVPRMNLQIHQIHGCSSSAGGSHGGSNSNNNKNHRNNAHGTTTNQQHPLAAAAAVASPYASSSPFSGTATTPAAAAAAAFSTPVETAYSIAATAGSSPLPSPWSSSPGGFLSRFSAGSSPSPRAAASARQWHQLDEDSSETLSEDEFLVEEEDSKMPARRSPAHNDVDLDGAAASAASNQQQLQNDSNNNPEVIDMMDDDDDDDDDGIMEVHDGPARGAAAAAAAAASSDNDENHWTCPQCTLHNPKHAICCNACHYFRGGRSSSSNSYNSSSNYDGGVRAPDPVRRGERLIPASDYISSGGSPLGYLSGGALLGASLGAAGAFLQGRPLTSSAVNGAVTGAVGGAVLNEVFGNGGGGSSRQQRHFQREQERAFQQAQAQQQQEAATANFASSSSAAARARNPYLRSGGSSRHSRRTVVHQSHRGPDGRMQFTTYSTSGGGGGGSADDFDPMLDFIRRSVAGRHWRGGVGYDGGGGMMNIDQMSYEQLLARFGDGSENLGADPADISRLPVSTLRQPAAELPEDCRQCLICLEDFDCGDQRKVLPCLHGFHARCVDKWLGSNGSCPICKHKIAGGGGGGGLDGSGGGGGG